MYLMNNPECTIGPQIINIKDPYAKFCVPDVVKNINVKIFNLMSSTNETRHGMNIDKCRCECTELIDKGICDTGFIWDGSNCERECDKSCNVAEYLDYENCKCRKKLADILVDECMKNIDENELIYNGTVNDYGNTCNSSTIYIVLLDIFFIISISMSSTCIYFHQHLKSNNANITNINANTETAIY